MSAFWSAPLTEAELAKLTLYKWTYAVEAVLGTVAAHDPRVRRLVFLRWLVATRRLRP